VTCAITVPSLSPYRVWSSSNKSVIQGGP